MESINEYNEKDLSFYFKKSRSFKSAVFTSCLVSLMNTDGTPLWWGRSRSRAERESSTSDLGTCTNSAALDVLRMKKVWRAKMLPGAICGPRFLCYVLQWRGKERERGELTWSQSKGNREKSWWVRRDCSMMNISGYFSAPSCALVAHSFYQLQRLCFSVYMSVSLQLISDGVKCLWGWSFTRIIVNKQK